MAEVGFEPRKEWEVGGGGGTQGKHGRIGVLQSFICIQVEIRGNRDEDRRESASGNSSPPADIALLEGEEKK